MQIDYNLVESGKIRARIEAEQAVDEIEAKKEMEAPLKGIPEIPKNSLERAKIKEIYYNRLDLSRNWKARIDSKLVEVTETKIPATVIAEKPSSCPLWTKGEKYSDYILSSRKWDNREKSSNETKCSKVIEHLKANGSLRFEGFCKYNINFLL